MSTSVAKTASSSSSLLSESLNSDSFDSVFPGDFHSPLPIEEEIEQQSYSDEDMGEATFVPPSSFWRQPDSPVAIVVTPKEEFCSVSEVQGEVQRLEDEMSQGSLGKSRARDAIDTINGHSSLYLDTDTTLVSEATPRTAQAYPPFMPADYMSINALKAVNHREDFRDWKPALQAKKRGREDPFLIKGKGVGHSRKINYSSDDAASDDNAGPVPLSAAFNRAKGSASSTNFHDDVLPNAQDKAVSKRKMITLKGMKTNKGTADSGWQMRQHQHQWRKLVNINIPEDPKRRSRWPPWLHPAFQIEDDGVIPRISHPDLQMLFQAVQHCSIKTQVYIELFNLIFGPIACWGREDEIFETIEAIGATTGDHHLVHLYDYLDRGVVQRPDLTRNHLFIVRFLGNFPSFASFQQRDQEYRFTLNAKLYTRLSDQMINWYGYNGEVDDYYLWATARLSVLDRHRDRPLSPIDLSSGELREWQEALDSCGTYEEAVTVTEEVFGPLEKIDYYDVPKVDIKKVWSPCQCSICNRSRKRVKVE